MKMPLEFRDYVLGFGSILSVFAFAFFAYRKGTRVHVTDEQTKNNRDAI